MRSGVNTCRQQSKVKVDTLASLDQSILIKPIARLKISVFRQIVAEIENLMRLS
jgi:hypothetical protein